MLIQRPQNGGRSEEAEGRGGYLPSPECAIHKGLQGLPVYPGDGETEGTSLKVYGHSFTTEHYPFYRLHCVSDVKAPDCAERR